VHEELRAAQLQAAAAPYSRLTAALQPPYSRLTAALQPPYSRLTAALQPPYCRLTAALLPPYCRGSTPRCSPLPPPRCTLTALTPGPPSYHHRPRTPPYRPRTIPFTRAPRCGRRRRRRTRRGCRRRRRSSRPSCASRRPSCVHSRRRCSPQTLRTPSSYGSSGAACSWRSAVCLPVAALCSRRERWAPPAPTPHTQRKVPRRACAQRADGPMDVEPGVRRSTARLLLKPYGTPTALQPLCRHRCIGSFPVRCAGACVPLLVDAQATAVWSSWTQYIHIYAYLRFPFGRW
jgi:hypothetical protein